MKVRKRIDRKAGERLMIVGLIGLASGFTLAVCSSVKANRIKNKNPELATVSNLKAQMHEIDRMLDAPTNLRKWLNSPPEALIERLLKKRQNLQSQYDNLTSQQAIAQAIRTKETCELSSAVACIIFLISLILFRSGAFAIDPPLREQTLAYWFSDSYRRELFRDVQ